MTVEAGAGEEPAATGSSPIDELCDRFTAELSGGRRPKIEDFLGGLKGSEHDAALRELLTREIALRRSGGQQPARAEYGARFSAPPQTIEAAVGAGTAADLTNSDAGEDTASARTTSQGGSLGPAVSVHATTVPDGHRIESRPLFRVRGRRDGAEA